jgi:hypothetical protein
LLLRGQCIQCGHQSQAQRLMDQVIGFGCHTQRPFIQNPLAIKVPPPNTAIHNMKY